MVRSAGIVISGTLPNASLSSDFSPSSAASLCNATSIEVNDRVITVLFSSAAGKVIVSDANFSSACPSAQEIATVGTERALKNSAAFNTSDVCPEREINTGTHALDTGAIRSGYSKTSEAGTARARTPAHAVMVAAAQSAT